MDEWISIMYLNITEKREVMKLMTTEMRGDIKKKGVSFDPFRRKRSKLTPFSSLRIYFEIFYIFTKDPGIFLKKFETFSFCIKIGLQ